MDYSQQSHKARKEVIGLVPAAGKASRIAPLPCSKELYPVGFRSVSDEHNVRPKVISHYLLEKMRLANIKKVYLIIRDGKWDIPSYFCDGQMLDMHIAYLMMNLPFGVPFTLDQAYPFVRDSLVALGFPDTIMKPDDVYARLIARLEHSGADIVLGLFPAMRPQKTDMVKLDPDGRVVSIYVKPEQTDLQFAWEIAVWTPVFTKFMHEYVISRRNHYLDPQMEDQDELFVGDVIQHAIDHDIHTESVIFPDGSCLDIGTPEDLLNVFESGKKDDHASYGKDDKINSFSWGQNDSD